MIPGVARARPRLPAKALQIQISDSQEGGGRAVAPAAVPANDRASADLASHPPGCTCAVHLGCRKKAVGAG